MAIDHNVLFDQSKYRASLAAQRQALKAKRDARILYAINGGIFSATPELVSLVRAYIDLEYDKAVICDNNDTPILIEDLPTFLKTVVSVLAEASNGYFADFEKLRIARTPKAVVEPEVV